MSRMMTSTLAVCCLTACAFAEKAYTLTEPAQGRRTFRVQSTVKAAGKLRTPAGAGKVRELDLKLSAAFGYTERRLSGAGREAAALRAARVYEQARAEINVAKSQTVSKLRPGRGVIVAQGGNSGPLLYDLKSPLTFTELELLQTPGDSLAVLSLLPGEAVEVGETWSPPRWSGQMLTGLHALLKSELKCKLASVADGTAVVEVTGRIQGAVDGSGRIVEVDGKLRFDLEGKHVARLDWKQTDQSSIGPVSPGTDLTIDVTLKRTPAESTGKLSDEALKAVPLEPTAKHVQLELRTPWGLAFRHSRQWRVFHQTSKLVILRLIDESNGSLIAQMNLARLASEAPGKHVAADQFVRDVAESLGERLKKIEETKSLDTDNGAFLHRTVVTGAEGKVGMRWIYYLYAHPTGRQASLVFSVEDALRKKLRGQDEQIVRSLDVAR